MVDIKATGKFKNPLTLNELKALPQLEGMALLQKGTRLSVQPVSEIHWNLILRFSNK